MRVKKPSLKIPKIKGYTANLKLYDGLVEGNVIGIHESLRNKKTFAYMYDKSDPVIKKLLDQLRRQGASSVLTLMEDLEDTDNQAIIRNLHTHQYSLGIATNNFGKTSLALYKVVEQSSRGIKKGAPILDNSKLAYHIAKLPKLEVNTSEEFARAITGHMGSDMDVVRTALDQFIAFMQATKSMIDAHKTKSGDKIVLGFATYASEKGETGFKGYVITGHKVSFIVQHRASYVSDTIREFCIKNGFIFNDKYGTFLRNIEAFSDAMTEGQTNVHPVGDKFEVNLAEVRIGVDKGYNAYHFLKPVISVGKQYLDYFEALYSTATTLKKDLGKTARPSKLSRGGEDMVNMILKKDVL